MKIKQVHADGMTTNIIREVKLFYNNEKQCWEWSFENFSLLVSGSKKLLNPVVFYNQAANDLYAYEGPSADTNVLVILTAYSHLDFPCGMVIPCNEITSSGVQVFVMSAMSKVQIGENKFLFLDKNGNLTTTKSWF